MRFTLFIAVLVLIFAGLRLSSPRHLRHPNANDWSSAKISRTKAQLEQYGRQLTKRFQPALKLDPVKPISDAPKQADEYAFQFVVPGHPQLEVDDAIDAAFQEAQEKVGDYLLDQNLATGWRPPVDFIKGRLLRNLDQSEVHAADLQDASSTGSITIDSPGRGRLEAVEKVQTVDGTPMYQVYLRIAATPDDVADMQNLARQHRMGTRMVPLAAIIGCLVALFAAIGLYIRFDELSKGYYRMALRVGAFGFVALVCGAAIWWLVRFSAG